MNHIPEFPTSVIEAVQSYVYLLRDPRNDQIFYIGKGAGNRVFCHVKDALEIDSPSDKLDQIREILQSGLDIDHQIVRHGLTEDEAFEVEAALIDFVGLQGLTNLVQGHGSDDRGIMNVAEVIAKYEAPPAIITEPAILITVNRLFHRGMSAEMLYEVTKGKWVLGERRNRAKYACAVYRGIIREVYEIERWQPSNPDDNPQMQQWIAKRGEHFEASTKQRWEFIGKVSSELRHYVGKSTSNYQTKHSQNPIKYINC